MSVPPAIGNAIGDALAPLGIVVDELPLTPNKIWKMIREAKNKKA
jgi:2-furoyl-CoA dehydrogenase large subunit